LPAFDETRAIVVVQSLLLWGAIVGSALWLARRKSPAKALAFMAIAFTFLRLRDASSAVMPEALAVTLLLVLTAALLAPPRRGGFRPPRPFDRSPLFAPGAPRCSPGIVALRPTGAAGPCSPSPPVFRLSSFPSRCRGRSSTIPSTASDTRSSRAPTTLAPAWHGPGLLWETALRNPARPRDDRTTPARHRRARELSGEVHGLFGTEF
jgi:hypothetical protein